MFSSVEVNELEQYKHGYILKTLYSKKKTSCIRLHFIC